MAESFTIIDSGRNKFSLHFRELWQYRELVYYFSWRDIKVKYKQTLLGFLWAVIQPLLLMVIFSLFFGLALKVPSNGIPYPVFVYSGLMLWTIFSSGLSNASNSMIANENIIKKIYFPRLIIPISSIIVALFDFLMAFVVYVGILIFYKFEINLFKLITLLPLSVVLTIITTFGLGTLLAALNIKYRDFRYIIPFFIQALLFVTPVIYPVSIVNNTYLQFILNLNPMAGAINLARGAIINQPLDWGAIGLSSSIAILLLGVGIFVFRKTEHFFADIA